MSTDLEGKAEEVSNRGPSAYQPNVLPLAKPAHSLVAVVDRFHMELFSALEQTHCPHFACDSELVTIAF